MKYLSIILVLLLSVGLYGIDIGFFSYQELYDNNIVSDTYTLTVEGKYLESSYSRTSTPDTVHTRYSVKIPYQWKKFKASLQRTEIQIQDVYLTRLDLRYVLEKNWLASADVGIASEWNPRQSWKFVLGKSLEKEIAILATNIKIKSQTDFSTSDFQKYFNESKIMIDFFLGKLKIKDKTIIPQVFLSFMYELKYYDKLSLIRQIGFKFSL